MVSLDQMSEMRGGTEEETMPGQDLARWLLAKKKGRLAPNLQSVVKALLGPTAALMQEALAALLPVVGSRIARNRTEWGMNPQQPAVLLLDNAPVRGDLVTLQYLAEKRIVVTLPPRLTRVGHLRDRGGCTDGRLCPVGGPLAWVGPPRKARGSRVCTA